MPLNETIGMPDLAPELLAAARDFARAEDRAQQARAEATAARERLERQAEIAEAHGAIVLFNETAVVTIERYTVHTHQTHSGGGGGMKKRYQPHIMHSYRAKAHGVLHRE